ncbi:MAG: thiamine phosphate synthase [Endomicrobiales bacterium]|nr:thiamine phosphate synthase [Endomicrobiales bacterium]
MRKNKLYCRLQKQQDAGYAKLAGELCAAGCDALIFGDRAMPAKELIALSVELKEICAKQKVLYILSSRVDVAYAADADGVHLSEDDIPVETAKQIVGPGKIVGAEASSLGHATKAAEAGADYIAVGPVFASHRAGARACGVDAVRMIKKRVKADVLVFGGINDGNAREAMDSGADGLLVSKYIYSDKSPKDAIMKLREKLSLRKQENGL